MWSNARLHLGSRRNFRCLELIFLETYLWILIIIMGLDNKSFLGCWIAISWYDVTMSTDKSGFLLVIHLWLLLLQTLRASSFLDQIIPRSRELLSFQRRNLGIPFWWKYLEVRRAFQLLVLICIILDWWRFIDLTFAHW